jgi:hypothetical protein
MHPSVLHLQMSGIAKKVQVVRNAMNLSVPNTPPKVLAVIQDAVCRILTGLDSFEKLPNPNSLVAQVMLLVAMQLPWTLTMNKWDHQLQQMWQDSLLLRQ